MQLFFCAICKIFSMQQTQEYFTKKTIFIMDFLPKLKLDINVDTIQTVVKQGDVQHKYWRQKWKIDMTKISIISL